MYNILFIGIGKMGSPMAGYLSKNMMFLFIIVQKVNVITGSKIIKGKLLINYQKLIKNMILLFHV